MSEKIKLVALFEDIDKAAVGIDALEDLGLAENHIEVISGAPIQPGMLGRRHFHTRVPKFALGGSILGGFIGFFLAFVSPNLYKVYVGGKPLSPGAPSIVVMFEMIMLFMLISTFLGVFYESVFPDYRKKEYVSEISDGQIAMLFDCEPQEQSRFSQALSTAGAASVRVAERQQP
ncbi:DUF3341 domain-containing protein [bacterium]|nr:DUF3341 domain-containing protein [bacterium]